MKEIDFLDAVGRVNRQYTEECITYRPPQKMNVQIKRMGAIAACFLVVIGVILMIRHINQPVITDENGFYIENGVLLRYTGSETDVTIPEAVETIADYAFLGNESRKKIEVVRLGTNVQQVETNAFAGLENLTDIVIAENNLSFVEENGLIMTSDGSVLLHYEREGETKFTIPESVRFVAAHAVQGTALEEIDFGEKLEYIGYYAFAGNYKLKAISLPDSVKYIGKGAFSDCTSAVDGTIPRDAELGENAFWCVPFYNTMLAGQMCPGEEIVRGLITPSEAIRKSDLYSLTEQITYVLASLRGDTDYAPSEAAMFGYAAVYKLPAMPEGMIVPETFVIDDLSFVDSGWGNTGVYDLQIFLPAGEYSIVMEAYGYGLMGELYWSESRFRLADVYFVKNAPGADPNAIEGAFGWTVTFERDGEYYTDITLIHEDGRIIHQSIGYHSSEVPTVTFSPEGTRVAVEYHHIYGYYSFYVISLNRDILNEPNDKYSEYLNTYYGAYAKGSLRFADEDNIEGENEFGTFRWNIYQARVSYPYEEPKQPITADAPVPYYSVSVDTLPSPARDARLTVQLIGGSPLIYVFDDDMRFYLAYLDADMDIATLYACTFSLPDGYSDGRIIDACGRGGSGEFCIYLSAQVGDQTAVLGYLFRCGDGAPQLYEIVADNEYTAHFDSTNAWINWLYNTGDADAFPSSPYTITVSGFDDTTVTFAMEGSAKPVSITAYGQTVPLAEGTELYGNYTFDLFEAEGAVIFSWGYYNIGNTYIIGENFTQALAPGAESSIHLYTDESGNLRYMRIHNRIADIVQTGGLSVARGYDDFLYCCGDASIENGRLLLGDTDESYTIGDRYDLDLEFESMYSNDYASIQDVFAQNRL